MSDNQRADDNQRQERENIPAIADRNDNLDALELLREAPAIEAARPVSPSPATTRILGGFEIVVPLQQLATVLSQLAVPQVAALRVEASQVEAPTTDAFAQAPPAGGAETGGFNPAMFGD